LESIFRSMAWFGLEFASEKMMSKMELYSS